MSTLQPGEFRGAARASVEGPSSRALVLIAACAAAAGALTALHGPEFTHVHWSAVITLAALGMTAERFDIDLYGRSKVSLSIVFMLMAAVAFGPAAVLVVNPAVALAGHLGRKRPISKLVFNASAFVLAGMASVYAYHGSLGAMPDDTPFQALAVVAAALADFAINSALVAAIVGLADRQSMRRVWQEQFAWLLPHYAVIGFLAFVLVLAYHAYGEYGILGFVAPVLMTRFTMKQYVNRTERTVRELRATNARIARLSGELERAYSETLTAFVSALDVRDVETHDHSTRVTLLALELGRSLGIHPGTAEWLDLQHGAILHDVGKIGVPDAILRKPGPLTDEEWGTMHRHPADGHRILSEVHFLASAATLVLAHHERYDGTGYPRGLTGEEIPPAARIFMVADAFDAITSERPYRPARSEAEACEEIRRHSGTQFDPKVVDALLRIKRPARLAA